MKKISTIIASVLVLLGIGYLISQKVDAGAAAGFGQPGVYNSSAITLTNGQFAGLELDVAGNLRTTTNYSRYATTSAQTGLIKLGPGVLHTVSVLGTTTLTNIGLYDATTTFSGTLIGTTTIGTTGQGTYTLDVPFTNGLWIGISGAAVNLVISYQ